MVFGVELFMDKESWCQTLRGEHVTSGNVYVVIHKASLSPRQALTGLESVLEDM